MSAESNPQEEDAGELPPIVAAATAGNHVAAASAAAGSNDIAAVVAAAPKTAPPGAKSFQKCQTEGAAFLRQLEQFYQSLVQSAPV